MSQYGTNRQRQTGKTRNAAYEDGRITNTQRQYNRSTLDHVPEHYSGVFKLCVHFRCTFSKVIMVNAPHANTPLVPTLLALMAHRALKN